MTDLQSSKHFTGSVALASHVVPYDATVRFSFSPGEEGLTKITETTSANVSQLAAIVTQLVNEKTATLSRDTCGLNTSLQSNVVGLSTPEVTAHFSVKAEKWKCISADVPCPTFSKPLRFCRKEAKSIVGGGYVNETIHILPAVDQGQLKISTTSDSDVHLDTQTKVLGSVVAGLLAGAPGSIAFVAFGDQIAKSLANVGLQLPPPPTVPIPGAAGDSIIYAPKLLGARFDDLHGGIGLILVRVAIMKTGTACFFRDQIPK